MPINHPRALSRYDCRNSAGTGWRRGETQNRVALGAVSQSTGQGRLIRVRTVGADDEHPLVGGVARLAGDNHHRSYARHGLTQALNGELLGAATGVSNGNLDRACTSRGDECQ